VFAQSLAFGEGKDGDGSRLLVDDGPADNGSFLVIDQFLQGLDAFLGFFSCFFSFY
jgi:hypothetical protein